jgi:chemotaxis protein MotB
VATLKGARSSAYDLETSNPYIALTDVLINLIFILLFFSSAILFLGRLGQGDLQYKKAQDELKAALEKTFPLTEDPRSHRPKRAVWNNNGKNDPPGTQRWVLDGQGLFARGSSEFESGNATRSGGSEIILKLAEQLRLHRNTWRRIRIEGHTNPPAKGQLDDWDLSAKRATVVAKLLSTDGRIASYYLSVSARAGQDPLVAQPAAAEASINERVEFVIEYAKQNASVK